MGTGQTVREEEREKKTVIPRVHEAPYIHSEAGLKRPRVVVYARKIKRLVKQGTINREKWE